MLFTQDGFFLGTRSQTTPFTQKYSKSSFDDIYVIAGEGAFGTFEVGSGEVPALNGDFTYTKNDPLYVVDRDTAGIYNNYSVNSDKILYSREPVASTLDDLDFITTTPMVDGDYGKMSFIIPLSIEDVSNNPITDMYRNYSGILPTISGTRFNEYNKKFVVDRLRVWLNDSLLIDNDSLILANKELIVVATANTPVGPTTPDFKYNFSLENFTVEKTKNTFDEYIEYRFDAVGESGQLYQYTFGTLDFQIDYTVSNSDFEYQGTYTKSASLGNISLAGSGLLITLLHPTRKPNTSCTFNGLQIRDRQSDFYSPCVAEIDKRNCNLTSHYSINKLLEYSNLHSDLCNIAGVEYLKLENIDNHFDFKEFTEDESVSDYFYVSKIGIDYGIKFYNFGTPIYGYTQIGSSGTVFGIKPSLEFSYNEILDGSGLNKVDYPTPFLLLAGVTTDNFYVEARYIGRYSNYKDDLYYLTHVFEPDDTVYGIFRDGAALVNNQLSQSQSDFPSIFSQQIFHVNQLSDKNLVCFRKLLYLDKIQFYSGYILKWDGDLGTDGSPSSTFYSEDENNTLIEQSSTAEKRTSVYSWIYADNVDEPLYYPFVGEVRYKDDNFQYIEYDVITPQLSEEYPSDYQKRDKFFQNYRSLWNSDDNKRYIVFHEEYYKDIFDSTRYITDYTGFYSGVTNLGTYASYHEMAYDASNNVRFMDNDGNIISETRIAHPRIMDIDDNGKLYVGGKVSTNRIKPYFTDGFVPSGNYGDSIVLQKKTNQMVWLVPDFDRLESNEGNFNIWCSGKLINVRLNDTADQIAIKFNNAGHNVVAHGGPLFERPVGIIGIDFRSVPDIDYPITFNDGILGTTNSGYHDVENPATTNFFSALFNGSLSYSGGLYTINVNLYDNCIMPEAIANSGGKIHWLEDTTISGLTAKVNWISDQNLNRKLNHYRSNGNWRFIVKNSENTIKPIDANIHKLDENEFIWSKLHGYSGWYSGEDLQYYHYIPQSTEITDIQIKGNKLYYTGQNVYRCHTHQSKYANLSEVFNYIGVGHKYNHFYRGATGGFPLRDRTIEQQDLEMTGSAISGMVDNLDRASDYNFQELAATQSGPDDNERVMRMRLNYIHPANRRDLGLE